MEKPRPLSRPALFIAMIFALATHHTAHAHIAQPPSLSRVPFLGKQNELIRTCLGRLLPAHLSSAHASEAHRFPTFSGVDCRAVIGENLSKILSIGAMRTGLGNPSDLPSQSTRASYEGLFKVVLRRALSEGPWNRHDNDKSTSQKMPEGSATMAELGDKHIGTSDRFSHALSDIDRLQIAPEDRETMLKAAGLISQVLDQMGVGARSDSAEHSDRNVALARINALNWLHNALSRSGESNNQLAEKQSNNESTYISPSGNTPKILPFLTKSGVQKDAKSSPPSQSDKLLPSLGGKPQKRSWFRKRRRGTMSINNAMMVLTDMLMAEQRERLLRNRESVRFHLLAQACLEDKQKDIEWGYVRTMRKYYKSCMDEDDECVPSAKPRWKKALYEARHDEESAAKISSLMEEIQTTKEERSRMLDRVFALEVYELKLEERRQSLERIELERKKLDLQRRINDAEKGIFGQYFRQDSGDRSIRDLVDKELEPTLGPMLEELHDSVSDTWHATLGDKVSGVVKALKKQDGAKPANTKNLDGAAQIGQKPAVKSNLQQEPGRKSTADDNEILKVHHSRPNLGPQKSFPATTKVAEKTRFYRSPSESSLASNITDKSTKAKVPSKIEAKDAMTGIKRIDQLRKQRLEEAKPAARAAILKSWANAAMYATQKSCYILTHLSFLPTLLRSGKKFSGTAYVKELGCSLRAYVQPICNGAHFEMGVELCSKPKNEVTADIFIVLVDGFQKDIELYMIRGADLSQGVKTFQRLRIEERKREGYSRGDDVAVRFFAIVIPKNKQG